MDVTRGDFSKLGGFFIHVYISTAREEGSFRSMIEGNLSIAYAKNFTDCVKSAFLITPR